MDHSLNPLIAIAQAKAQEPASDHGRFIEINGATLYYEEYGEGKPLLLLHGFGRTATDWHPFINDFATHFRVIAWDMRGYGRSRNPDTGIVFRHSTAAEDLLELMDVLKLDQVSSIGLSSGGIIILQAAVMQPDRFETIIPVSAQTYFSVETREFIENNSKPETYYEYSDGEILHGEENGMQLARQFYNFSKLKGDPAITPDQLVEIKARALIVHGNNDFVPVSQAWEMFQNIPNASLFIVPDGWHMPHLGEYNSDDFKRRTLEFLTK